MKYDVTTKAKEPKQTIVPEMLVKHIEDGSIGLVTEVTSKWVHVTWLVNTDPEDFETFMPNGAVSTGKHHFNTFIERSLLVPAPAGTTVTITQTVKE